ARRASRQRARSGVLTSLITLSAICGKSRQNAVRRFDSLRSRRLGSRAGAMRAKYAGLGRKPQLEGRAPEARLQRENRLSAEIAGNRVVPRPGVEPGSHA